MLAFFPEIESKTGHSTLLDEQPERSENKPEQGVFRYAGTDFSRVFRFPEMPKHHFSVALHHAEKDLLHFRIALKKFFRKDHPCQIGSGKYQFSAMDVLRARRPAGTLRPVSGSSE